MLKIIVDGTVLDLDRDFTVDIEESSPVFNDIGSQSVPATVPATGRNAKALGWPQRPDSASDPNLPAQSVLISDGLYIRSGVMNVTEASKTDGITFNIGFDNSTAYALWREKRLADLRNLPIIEPDDGGQKGILETLNVLYSIYRGTTIKHQDLAVFPVMVDEGEVLNVPGSHGLDQPGTVKRTISGQETTVTLPMGYGVTPFLKVWRVLDLIFADLGLRIISNPFIADKDLERLVVLNNVADTICRGTIDYKDLMPDVTVEEFLNALWVRFGLVYSIDSSMGLVKLELIRDIVDAAPSKVIDNQLSDWEAVTFDTPKYLTLTASQSIEGATPAEPRFEDFARGLDLSHIRMGLSVGSWTMSNTQGNEKWDGDDSLRDDDDQNIDPGPDYPEPDYPEPDYPDYAPDALSDNPGNESSVTNYPALEYITGSWFKLDSINGMVQATSSSFFDWDPATDGIEPLELSSVDEWVPIVVKGAYRYPAYLNGARHLHTYIKGTDNNDADGTSTPLSFMFAYTTVDHITVGRNTPEDETGRRMELLDGSVPTITLYFQFKDGLFANFWRRYDEILRHSARIFDVKVSIPKHEIQQWVNSILEPVLFKGVKCLIDKISYSMPAASEIEAELTLRALQPQGSYSIDKEQNVPDIAAGVRWLEWVVFSDGFNNVANSYGARKTAVDAWVAKTGYSNHGAPGNEYYVDPSSAIVKSCQRIDPWPPTMANFPSAGTPGQILNKTYRSRIVYSIHEIHDTSTGQDDGRHETIMPQSAGEIEVQVEYQVVFKAVWKS